MASREVCDATGKLLEGDFETVKGLSERTYSAEALADVQAYLDARDALHTRLAGEWAWGLLRLREEWRMKYPAGKLPDEF